MGEVIIKRIKAGNIIEIEGIPFRLVEDAIIESHESNFDIADKNGVFELFEEVADKTTEGN